MNKLILTTLSALCAAGLLSVARAQDNQPAGQQNEDTNNTAGAAQEGDATTPPPEMIVVPADDSGGTNAEQNGATNPPAPDKVTPPTPEDQPAAPVMAKATTPDDFMPPSAPGTNADELRLNFRNAPLEEVLNYLSDAAGFIIVLDTEVHGTVSVISKHPMTRDEAVNLLNAVLNQNGLAAIRNDRTLTIVDKNDAKTRNIPVKVSNDPDDVPDNAEIVTEIIPIRFVEADQLSKDLALFVSPQATIVANDAGNSIVVTDTQSNIKHLMEIIRAVDNSAEGETEIRVFHLEHANPTDVANELGVIFPSNNGGSSGSSTSPIRFGGGGGPGGFFSRMMAAGGGGGGSSSSSRMQKQTQVLATPDLRTSSVIVTASKDLMEEINGMMAQLDVASPRDQNVYVFHMNNGDTMEAQQILQNMFSGGSGSSSSRGGASSGSSSAQNSLLQSRETQNASSEGTGSSTTSGSSSGAGGGNAGRAGGGAGF